MPRNPNEPNRLQYAEWWSGTASKDHSLQASARTGRDYRQRNKAALDHRTSDLNPDALDEAGRSRKTVRDHLPSLVPRTLAPEIDGIDSSVSCAHSLSSRQRSRAGTPTLSPDGWSSWGTD